MPEREQPFDYSVFAPGLDFGDDSVPVLEPEHYAGAGHQFVLADELAADAALEADFGGLPGGDSELIPLDPAQDEHYRQFRDSLQRLGESMVDLQLEADEAWLESLLLEDPTEEPTPAVTAFDFDDLPILEDDL